MKEELINFETAKLAKEKGFNIGCKNKYVETLEHALEMGRGGDCTFPHIPTRVLTNSSYEKWDIVHCYAPTQSLLAKWLREVHNIIIDVKLDFFNSYNKESIKYYPIFYTYSDSKKRFWLYTDYINSDECTEEIQDKMPIFQKYSTYEEALEIGLQEGLKLIS